MLDPDSCSRVGLVDLGNALAQQSCQRLRSLGEPCTVSLTLRNLSFALFRSAEDAQPKPKYGTWEEIAELITTVRRSPRKVCGGKTCPEKNSWAWSPVLYPAGAGRLDSAITGVDIAVFDIEGPGHTPYPRAQLRPLVNALKDYAAALSTSHGGEGFWRLALPLSRTVTAQEWPAFWAALVEKFNIPADRVTRNIGRLFFLPTACEGTKTFSTTQKGKWIDVDEILGEGLGVRSAPVSPVGQPLAVVPPGAGAAVVDLFDDPGLPAAATVPEQHRAGAVPGPSSSAPPSTAVLLDGLAARLRQVRKPASLELAQRVLAGRPLAIVGEHDITLTRWAGVVANAVADVGSSFDAALILSERSFRGMGWQDGWEHLVGEFRKKFDRAAQKRAAQDEQDRIDAQLWEGVVENNKTGERDVQEPTAKNWKAFLIKKKDKEGNLIGVKNLELNAALVFEFDDAWKGRLRYNELTRYVEWVGAGGPLGRCLSINDWGTAAQIWLQGSDYKLELSEGAVAKALENVAKKNAYNPVAAYLDGAAAAKRWDGTKRLDRLFVDYAKAQDFTELTAKVGRKYMIGAVARARQPGCMMHNVLILEGDYGVGKSTFFATLACKVKGAYAKATIDPHDKDSMAKANRFWIVELDELAGMRKADQEALKSMLSVAVDAYRPPYGRFVEEFPRRSVYGGTTNGEDYLLEANRREWCVRMTELDKAAMERDIDQLWAEAVAAYEAGEPWHLDKADEKAVMVEAKKRQVVDSNEELIVDWFRALPKEKRPTYVSGVFVEQTILKLTGASSRQPTKTTTHQLRSLGFEKDVVTKGGRQFRAWVTPAALLQDEHVEADMGDFN